MGVFVDANGNEIREITAENIEDYKKWLQTDKNPDVSHLFNSNDVSLADLAVSPYLDEKQAVAAAMMVYRDVARNLEDDRLNEYIDLAKKNRQVVALSWSEMGNSIGGRAFDNVLDMIDKRPAADNLAFILASIDVDISNVDYHTGKADDFSKISGENKKYAEELLKLAAQADERGYYDRNTLHQHIAAKCVERLVQNGSMVNLKTSNENREIILNVLSYSAKYGTIDEVLETVKPEYLNEEMLKRLAKKYAPAQQYKDTKNAKTQAEKNVNILPKGYHNFKKAVLNLINKQDKYDRSRYGEERGLNERYLEVCQKMGISEGFARNPKCMAGLYLETARKDIEEGRAARLDKTALSDVLKHDDGKYLAMLPPNFVQENKNLIESSLPNVKISLTEQNVADAYNFRIASLGERNRTTKENKKILENLEAEQKKIEPKIESLAKYREEENKTKSKVDTLSKIYIRKQETVQALRDIQYAFAQIQDCLKKGGSAAEETVLSAETIEQIMSDRLQGKKSVVQEPEHGSLPLLFGRKEEKERREKLAAKIADFNKLLDKEMPKIGERYSGKILTSSAFAEATMAANQAEREYSQANNNYWQQKQNIGKINEREFDNLTQRNNFIEQARERIQEKETQKKEAVKKLVGVPDKTAVQAVPQNAEKAEKAQIRRQNKQVEDKLATKEKTFAGKSDAEKVGLQKQRQNQAMR